MTRNLIRVAPYFCAICKAVTVVREPSIAMLRDIARGGYVGQCRAQFQPSILTRTSPKKAATKYFLFVQMKCKILGSTLV
jgi:hypothetical protein